MLEVILSSPIFIGGVIPMILFGFFDLFLKIFSRKFPLSIFVCLLAGGAITLMVGYDYFFGGQSLFTEATWQWKSIIQSAGLGIVWGCGIISMGYAYHFLKANASQIVPVVSGNALVTTLFGIFWLGEPVVAWKVLMGAILIFCGILFICPWNQKTRDQQTNFQSILVGGVVPLLCFGFLNAAYNNLINMGIPMALLIVMTAVGGVLVALAYGGILGDFQSITQKFSRKFVAGSLISGVFWALALIALGYGFYPLGGMASQIIPIVNASALLTAVMAIIFLKEKIMLWRVLIGVAFLFVGAWFLI